MIYRIELTDGRVDCREINEAIEGIGDLIGYQEGRPPYVAWADIHDDRAADFEAAMNAIDTVAAYSIETGAEAIMPRDLTDAMDVLAEADAFGFVTLIVRRKKRETIYTYPVTDEFGEAVYRDVSGLCGGDRKLSGPFAVCDYGGNVLATAKTWRGIQRRKWSVPVQYFAAE